MPAERRVVGWNWWRNPTDAVDARCEALDADDHVLGDDRDLTRRDHGTFPDHPLGLPRVPLPGVELALVPVADKLELRLRGPNVTPGYLRRPDLTAESPDEDGFFRTGDAVAPADPDDPAAGVVFRGRIAENFKLSSGTFVSVGTLRPRLLSASQGLLGDAVLCGENGDEVGALVWLHPEHAHRCPDGLPDDALRAELAATLERLAAEGGGASQRVERLLVLTDPAALDAGEITDKGYVNQRAVRERRADRVAELGAVPCPPHVVARA